MRNWMQFRLRLYFNASFDLNRMAHQGYLKNKRSFRRSDVEKMTVLSHNAIDSPHLSCAHQTAVHGRQIK